MWQASNKTQNKTIHHSANVVTYLHLVWAIREIYSACGYSKIIHNNLSIFSRLIETRRVSVRANKNGKHK